MENKISNRYETIIIIGNGFDLNLGLPTSYSSYIKSDTFKTLIQQGNQLGIYLEEKEQLQNWIDIENELKYYSENNDNSNFKSDFESLCLNLCQYLKGLDYSNINESSIAFSIINQIVHYDSCVIIDFNYSQSVKYILSRKGLTDQEIDTVLIKVHGEAQKDKIIFGVEDNAHIKKEHVFLKKAYNLHYNTVNFKQLFEDAHLIAIFGHSLGETDHTYFHSLFSDSCSYYKNKENRNFILFYYRENGYYQLLQQLDELTTHSLSAFRQYNNVTFIDTSKP